MGLLDRLFGPALPSAVAEAATGRRGRGALLASAAIVTPDEGNRIAKYRRPWQVEAFRYKRAVPEVGYVHRFLSNNSAHIRLFAGDRPRGADEVAELDDNYSGDLPADLVEAAREALLQLTGATPSGGGASILGPIVSNFEGPGECWLIGQFFPETGEEVWGVHSVSEVRFMDGRYPGAPDGTKGYYRLITGEDRRAETVDLDPATTTCIRMWTADTEYTAEPDSPMRTLLGVCQQLLLIERGMNASLRSRAAGNGFLLMPEEITLGGGDYSDGDPDSGDDEFLRDFTTQLVTPLTQDGSAAQVVPGLITGPYQYLDKVRHLTLDRPMDPATAERETRLLARLGIGLDVPPEVITGYADVNHWNVAQISQDTFKQHQEPATINGCEALTIGYLRNRLRAANRWPVELVNRVVIWYDPSSLITPPDMRDAANAAHGAGAINDATYRRALGFDESDAPEEIANPSDAPVGTTGMLVAQLTEVAKAAQVLLFAGYAPDSVSAALGLSIEHTGIVPKVNVPSPTPDDTTGAAPTPALPAAPPAAPPAIPAPATPPAPAQPPAATASAALSRLVGRRIVVQSERLALTAAAPPTPTAKHKRLSRRLMQIDRSLRERITQAADAALQRALERAGNRVRNAAQRNEQARTASSGVPGERVAAAVGRTLVAALGLNDDELLADAFARLRTQYTEWSTAAAEEAIDTAAELAGLPRDSDEVRRMVGELRDTFAESIDASWPQLEAELNDLAQGYLYNPDPSAAELGELPDSLVPPGLVRAALAYAGGLAADHTGSVQAGQPLPGLTSGETLSNFLRGAGQVPAEYEWSYGISSRPFPPHRSLDGLTFADFTDAALSTAGFPGYGWVGDSFVPGDHKGCHCDYSLIYADGSNTGEQADTIGAQAYAEQNPGTPLPTRRATVDGFAD